MSARVLAALFAAVVLSGCQPLSNVCGQTEEKVLLPDGQVHRCARAEDCPRGSGVLVCVTDGALERECVSCSETECVRRVPEPCQ